MNRYDAINLSSAAVITLTLVVGVPLIMLDRTDPVSADVIASPEARAEESIPLSDERPLPLVEDAAPLSPGTEIVELVYIKDLPPCDNEDGTVTVNGVHVYTCVWDAALRGNGIGDSFIVFSR